MFNKHIKKNIISKFFGFGIGIVNQVLLIPIYIKVWGIDKYGDWIILSSIMSFFVMSNIGLNDVIANKFVIGHSEKKYDYCRKALNNNYFFLIFMFIICVLGITFFLLQDNLSSILSLNNTSEKTIVYVFYFQLVQIFIAQFSAVFNPIYRSTKKTYRVFYLEDGAILCELLIVLLCVILNTDFIILTFLLIFPKLIVWLYKSYDIKKYFKYSFLLSDFDFDFLKKTAYPSLSFMAFPLGYAIVNQGFTLMVGSRFGTTTLILFNTTRTLSNLIKSFTSILQASIWPEFSIAYGEKDFDTMRFLHRRSLQISTVVTLFVGMVILVLGPTFYKIWTHNKIEFDYSIMIAFLITVTFSNIWYSSSIVMMATNRHSLLGVIFLALSFLSIGIAYTLINMKFHLLSIVLCLLIIDIPIAFFVVGRSLKQTQDTFVNLFKFSK